MTEREANRAYENDSMYAIVPEETATREPDPPNGFTKTSDLVLSSENAEKLSKNEIVSILEANSSLNANNE